MFESVFYLKEHLENSDVIGDLFPKTFGDPEFEWVDFGDGKGRIFESFNYCDSAYAYRGQNERFTPCVSSLLRGEINQRDIIICRSKLEEMKNLIDSSGMKEIADEIGLVIDYEAIAQHYGLKTRYLDITRSLDVAIFFACCKLNKKNQWEPVVEGTGVIYRMPFIPGVNVEMVGAQIFPRPKEQQAHAIEIKINDDFEKRPYVEIFEFKHDCLSSEKVLELFEGGDKIMPYDLLAEKAKIIEKNKFLSERIIRKMMVEDGVPKNEIRKKIKELNVYLIREGKGKVLSRSEVSYSKKEKKDIKRKAESIKSNILSNVGCRAVYRP